MRKTPILSLLLLFVTVGCFFVGEANAQRGKKCSTSSDHAQIVIANGDIDLQPCDGRQVKIKGTPINTGSGGGTSPLPSQTGNGGKYLQTDGTNPSWQAAPTSGGGTTASTADYTVTANTFSGADLGQKVENASADVMSNTLLTGTARTRTCSVASGSTALTCTGGFSFVRGDVGQIVSGGGVGTAVLIAATDSATTAVLSKPSGAAISSVALTFSQYRGGMINILSDATAANITTAINNYPNIIYKFGVGDFKFNLPEQGDTPWIERPLMWWDNSIIVGSGQNLTRLKSSDTAPALIAPKLTGRKNPVTANRFEYANDNIYLADLQILGDGTINDSINYTVGTGNAKNALIERVFFNASNSLPLGLGGFVVANSPPQSWGINQTVRNCRFENNVHNNLNIVDNERVEVYNNYFGSISNPSATAGGISYIDGEPNSGLSRMVEISIHDNTFFTQNLLNTGGTLKDPLGAVINFVYPSSAANLDYARGLIIKNNRVVGGGVYYYDANGARGDFAYAQIAAGIHVDSYNDVTITGNNISWTSQDSIYCGRGSNWLVADNQVDHNGSSFSPIVLDTTVNSIVKNNFVGATNNNIIAELNGTTSKGNYFENNKGAVISLLAGSDSKKVGFVTGGDGSQFLANDGTYKSVTGGSGSAANQSNVVLVGDGSCNSAATSATLATSGSLFLRNCGNGTVNVNSSGYTAGTYFTIQNESGDGGTIRVNFPAGTYVILNSANVLTNGGYISANEQGFTMKFTYVETRSGFAHWVVENYRGALLHFGS